METRGKEQKEAMSDALTKPPLETTEFKFASSNHTTERTCPIKTGTCSESIPALQAQATVVVKRPKKDPIETITIFNLQDIRQFRTKREAEKQAKESKRTRRSFNSLSEEEQLAIALKRSMEQE